MIHRMMSHRRDSVQLRQRLPMVLALLLVSASTSFSMQIRLGAAADWFPSFGAVDDGYVGSSHEILSQSAYGVHSWGGLAWRYFAIDLKLGWMHRSIDAIETPVLAEPVPGTRISYEFNYLTWGPELWAKREWEKVGLEIGLGLSREFRSKLKAFANEEEKDGAISLGTYLAWKGISIRYQHAILGERDGNSSFYRETFHDAIGLGYEMRFNLH